MKPYRKIHSSFKLNGIPYSQHDLREVGYSLVKEGEPFEKAIGDFLLDWMDEHPTLKVNTSGSTGKPKPISLQKNHMVNSALATGEFFGLRPGDSALLCLPTDYIAGKMMVVRAIVLGLELDYVPPSSNPLADVGKTYDFCAMVPLQLENSLEGLRLIETLIVGGAPVSAKLRNKVYESVQLESRSNRSTEVFETYGMTETITHIALKRIDNGFGDVSHQSFRTLPNIEIGTDDRGCLFIDAPKITDERVVTNDMVYLISETEFEWLGRYDNVINSGGVKFFPEQIEAKLEAVIPARFFVAGLPDKKLGERLVLIVKGKIEEERLSRKIESLKSLEKFEAPKEIYQVCKFYETDSGKIQRSKALEMVQQERLK